MDGWVDGWMDGWMRAWVGWMGACVQACRYACMYVYGCVPHMHTHTLYSSRSEYLQVCPWDLKQISRSPIGTHWTGRKIHSAAQRPFSFGESRLPGRKGHLEPGMGVA